MWKEDTKFIDMIHVLIIDNLLSVFQSNQIKFKSVLNRKIYSRNSTFMILNLFF